MVNKSKAKSIDGTKANLKLDLNGGGAKLVARVSLPARASLVLGKLALEGTKAFAVIERSASARHATRSDTTVQQELQSNDEIKTLTDLNLIR